MRGAKGGFWNNLLIRIRRLFARKKVIKTKEERLYKQKKTKEKILKNKKEAEEILYFYNKKKRVLPKKIIVVKKKNLTGITEDFKLNKRPKKEKIIKIDSTKRKSKEKPPKNILKPKVFNKQINNNPVIINEKPKIKHVKPFLISNNKPATKNKKGIGIVESITIKEKAQYKLLIEIEKIIEKDKYLLNQIMFKLDEINIEINNTTDINKLRQLEQKLQNLINKINEIINNYNLLKNPDIESLKKLNSEKINNSIEKLKANGSVPTIIHEIQSKYINKLNYYSNMVNTKTNISNLKSKNKNKQILVREKTNIFNEQLNDLSNVRKMNIELKNKLNEQEKFYQDFEAKIAHISPDKIVNTKYKYVGSMLNTTSSLAKSALAVPLIGLGSLPLFAVGLFLLNSSVKNVRRSVIKTTTVNFIPSENFCKEIEYSKNQFYIVDYLLSDSLYQISRLKYDYISEFNGYHHMVEFENSLNKITQMEKQIIDKQKKIEEMKDKMDAVLDKNRCKVKRIKDMNK